MEIIHPEYHQVSESEFDHIDETLTPVYPATEGLTQFRLRKLTGQAIAILKGSREVLEELIPDKIVSDINTPTLRDAIIYLHNPPGNVDIELLTNGNHPAQKRLVIEELLAYQTSLRMLRKKIRVHSAFSFKNINPELCNRFIEKLPFRLTNAQKKVIHDINEDLDRKVPMLRLVQGDVGSGKTVVAGVTAVRAVSAGLQVAFMAPTELLADQHYINIRQWLEPLGIIVLLLTGKLSKSDRSEVTRIIETQKPMIIIGTHALFQEKIEFYNLGLVIIDEQHRFGVHQRFALIEKGGTEDIKPHQLIMTATPIPRTLAMSIFAELDVSTIDELPPGREPVKTVVISNQKRNEVTKRISSVCDQGNQVYWVCTLIEESDTIQSQAAVRTYESLCQVLPDLKIGLVHGRLKSAEKERIMGDFKKGEIQLLVATTVIEVGVDVVNATLMIIENSERLGLSQLHQLRGRVGRGNNKSVCVLLYHPPLSENAMNRLEIMRNYTDGFIIAEKDLEMRGPGDLLGTRQTGLPQMKIANLVRDASYIPEIISIADDLIDSQPEMVKKLQSRWLLTSLDYGKV